MSKRFGRSRVSGAPETRTRYISAAVRRAVAAESAFVCAWCGLAITEFHHIFEFAAGGPSVADNLILLCPNCHSEVTSGTITEDDVRNRKSELPGRILRGAGNLLVPATGLNFSVGNVGVLNCENVLQVNDEPPLISASKMANRLLLSFRYFDPDGRLVAWMSKNRWWVDVEAGLRFIHSEKRLVVRAKNQPPALRLDVRNEWVELTGTFWVRGAPFSFTDAIRLASGLTFAKFSFDLQGNPAPCFRIMAPLNPQERGYDRVVIGGQMNYPYGLRPGPDGRWITTGPATTA